MTRSIDVLGFGNAIVDILCFCHEEDILELGLAKGTMHLVDHEAVQNLKQNLNPVSYRSGGSIANSLAHLSELGASCQFIGKVAHDDTGARFTNDLKQLGMQFATHPLEDGSASAHCYVFVTPDGQRTMCTYLGASSQLSSADLDEEAIGNASCIFLEGYLWYSATAKKLILEASETAKSLGTIIAFSLSDPQLVEIFHSELQAYVEEYVDILFANQLEAERLFCTKGIEDTTNALAPKVKTLVMTQGAAGSIVATGGQLFVQPAVPVPKVVDSTGAGDAYAAGILFGLSRNKPIPDCMEIAADIASEVIRHIGGRSDRLPEQTLRPEAIS